MLVLNETDRQLAAAELKFQRHRTVFKSVAIVIGIIAVSFLIGLAAKWILIAANAP
jgi:hypothetical protein